MNENDSGLPECPIIPSWVSNWTYEQDGKWYWCSPTGHDHIGPFTTWQLAAIDCLKSAINEEIGE